MSRRFSFMYSNDLRNYRSIAMWSKYFDKFLLPISEDDYIKSFKRISVLFKNKIDFKVKYNERIFFLPSSQERGKVNIIHKHKFNIFANIIQYFLRLFVKNKLLYFKDPYTINFIKRSKVLLENGINPIKSFYYNLYDKNSHYFKIESILSYASLILDKKYKNSFKKKIYLNLINFELTENYSKINNLIYSCQILLKKYQPNSIILPNDITLKNQIIGYLSKARKIKTFVLSDGFYLYNKNFYFINKLYNFYLLYGNQQVKTLRKYKLKSKLFSIGYYPQNKKSFLVNKKKFTFDASILAYSTPFSHSENSVWDRGIFIECDILNLFNELNMKRVFIKIKNGIEANHEVLIRKITNYKKIYLEVFNKKLKLDIEVSQDDLIGESKFIVGPLSSAIIESSLKNRHYYIFEPSENGLCNYMLKNTIFNKSFIATDKKNLKKNIINNNYFNIKPDIKKNKKFNFMVS